MGVIIWIVLFVILPVENKEPLQIKTITFISLNYLSLILGFYTFRFNSVSASSYNEKTEYIIKGVIVLLIGCYALRWYDLFYIRGLSFDYLPKVNRAYNDQNYFQSNILLILASILKSIYFFPYVIIRLFKKHRSKIIIGLSYFIMFFPVIEAILKGNRKPFFEIFFIIVITNLLIIKRLQRRHFVKFLLGFIALLIVSMFILFNREKLNTDEQKTLLIEAKYNDLLAPKEKVIDYITSEDNSFKFKLLLLTTLHIGQYYTHGVFEFNNFIHKKEMPVTYGKYTFNTVPKLINKTKLFKPIVSVNPSPREYVYITTFGGFYLDFRWFTLLLMFLFGVFQKYVFEKSKVDFLWTPMVIYLVTINLFLIVINYIRGAGIYPFVSILLLLVIIKCLRKRVA